MRLLVIGGTEFFGKRIVEQSLARGDQSPSSPAAGAAPRSGTRSSTSAATGLPLRGYGGRDQEIVLAQRLAR